MLRPFENIKKVYFDIVLRQRDDYKEDFKQSQEFITWIVGFSVGGLYLLLSNLDKAQCEFGHCFIKLFIILLTTSITSGVVYKISITNYREFLRRTSLYLEAAFSSENTMSIQPVDISYENDVNVVVQQIKIDFGEDTSALIENYSNLNTEAQQAILNHLKRHYKNTASWAKKDYEIGMDHVKEVFKKAFGISEKKFNKIANNNTLWWLNFWKRSSLISFMICCLAFIVVPLTVCIIY